MTGLDVFELLKTTGSLLGLVTGCFLIWDRFMRDRPFGYFRLTTDKQAGVRIENPRREPIIIHHIVCEPDDFRCFVEGLQWEAAIDALYGPSPAYLCMIDRREGQTFRLVPRQKARPASTGAMTVTIHWRLGRNTRLSQWPLRISFPANMAAALDPDF